MKKLKRNTDGIHNRGSHVDYPGALKASIGEMTETVTDPPFYMPTDGEVKRALKLRQTALAFRNAANDVKVQAPHRAGLLERRARMMELKAALLLLGEGDADY